MKQTTLFREFIRYSSFSILGMIGISCYILADTFFVAQGVGTNGLAALNLAIPAYNFINGTGLMLGMGGATKYSIYKSQKKEKEADHAFTTTIRLAIASAVLFALAGLFFSGPLSRLLGADKAVFEMTNTYLQVLLLFSPAFICNDIMLCFVRNDGNPRLSMIATVTGSFANIILDYIFIFPCGMGIFGAVFATGISPVTSICMMGLLHWRSKRRGFHFTKETPVKGMALGTLSLGFPSLVAQLSSGIVMITFNKIILSLEGNTGVAAYGVVANISLVVVSIYNGIAQGIQPLTSQAYGQSCWKDARRLLRYAMISMSILSVILYAFLFGFADPIAQLFNSENNAALYTIAVQGLKLYFTAVLFVGFNIILSMYFSSTEKAMPAQIISLLRGIFLIIPIAFLLAFLFDMTGVWLAFPATECLVAVLGIFLYKRTFSKKTSGI